MCASSSKVKRSAEVALVFCHVHNNYSKSSFTSLLTTVPSVTDRSQFYCNLVPESATNMRSLAVVVLCLIGVCFADEPTEELEIKVLKKPEDCEKVSQNYDNLVMHYTGTLANGEKFDSRWERGRGFDNVLGQVCCELEPTCSRMWGSLSTPTSWPSFYCLTHWLLEDIVLSIFKYIIIKHFVLRNIYNSFRDSDNNWLGAARHCLC